LGNYNQVSGYGDVCYLVKVVELNKLEEFWWCLTSINGNNLVVSEIICTFAV
jgi:hypothetical protein